MLKNDEYKERGSCWNKALWTERMFMLLARDFAAPETINFWCDKRIEMGLNKEDDALIKEARECATLMESERKDVRDEAECSRKNPIRKPKTDRFGDYNAVFTKPRGIVITIEGPQATGKTLLAGELVSRFTKDGLGVRYIPEREGRTGSESPVRRAEMHDVTIVDVDFYDRSKPDSDMAPVVSPPVDSTNFTGDVDASPVKCGDCRFSHMSCSGRGPLECHYGQPSMHPDNAQFNQMSYFPGVLVDDFCWKGEPKARKNNTA